MQEQRARAFARWRAGSHQLHYYRTPERRIPYEQAVAQALAYLQRYHTMEELLQAYLEESAPDAKAWLAAACAVADSRPLSAPVVEDAAFWRRAQQLIGGRVQERPS